MDPSDPSKGFVDVDYDEELDDQFLTPAQRKHKKLMKMRQKKTIELNVDGAHKRKLEDGTEIEISEEEEQYYDEEDEDDG